MNTEPDSASSFMTDAQRELMVAVLDRIVPRDGERPGAGEAGVAGHIDRVVGDSRHLKRWFADGLAAIAVASRALRSLDFAELSAEDKDTVLRQIESERHDFFEALVKNTYGGYYSDPKVLRILGLEDMPPQPRGYELEPFDLALLENVKKRGKVYRDA
jgi:hypothetical protein